MRKLLIGTSNPAKLKEYKNLLKGLPLEVIGLSELKIKEYPEETGRTFEENAVIKARHYYAQTGLPTLVDDGGFEVEALGGEPGVKSHRWIGREMTDEEIINEVLNRLSKAGTENRKCRLNLVMALATPFGIALSEAAVEGIVAEKPARKRIKGYPYRSIMYFPNYGKYFVDLTEEEHEILNHRKAALDKIKDILFELTK